MSYHHTYNNKNPNFNLIKKNNTREFSCEGMVKLTNNTINSVDNFSSTIIFNNHTKFMIGDGDFIMGICNSSNPYNKIVVNLEHGGIGINGLDSCVQMAKFPSVKQNDIISFTCHDRGLYLTINDIEYLVFNNSHVENIISSGNGLFKIVCHMSSKTKKWNCEKVFASISFLD